MRRLILLLLTSLLFWESVLEVEVSAFAAGPSLQQDTSRKPTLQERILEVETGTMIEVQLLNKPKIRGRLGEVTNEGFTLLTAQGNKIEMQKIAFTEVKSFKQVGGGTGEKIGKGFVYALAGIGALMTVLIIVALAKGD